MRIFNKNKTQELFDVDLEKGRLVDDKIVTHHEAVEGRVGKSHYEVVKEYPNGGKDVKEVWDEEPIKAQEAWDECEEIKIFVPYSEAELQKIADAKKHQKLKNELVNVMEDVAQEQLGIVRDDYAKKRKRAAEIINELRLLEGKTARTIKN